MYSLYVESCEKNNINPVKISYYRKIFNNNYNLGFHVPKSDRCDKCEEYKVKKTEGIAVTEEGENKQQRHLTEKIAMRENKKKDKDSDEIFLVIFDLENVITLPKAEVSGFFYKMKLALYNLTANTSNKQGYCSIWTEAVSGRAGNDLASAFIALMEKIVADNPTITHYVTWSDSCMPQNRNSILSQAIAEFMSRHPHIKTFELKYSIAGHSCMQEVDIMHKQIEDAMNVAEFYSPVPFLRILLNVNRRKPYRVIQMRQVDFKDHQTCAKHLRYNLVPFSKVTALRLHGDSPYDIEFKTSHTEESTRPCWIEEGGAETKGCSTDATNVERKGERHQIHDEVLSFDR